GRRPPPRHRGSRRPARRRPPASAWSPPRSTSAPPSAGGSRAAPRWRDGPPARPPPPRGSSRRGQGPGWVWRGSTWEMYTAETGRHASCLTCPRVCREDAMARAIWKGSITFGLVNIPVGLYSAEKREEVAFHLLDRRNMSRVRYKRVNEKNDREVPWEETVRGYEYEEGQ